MTKPYIQLRRSKILEELLAHPREFHLLSVIAFRAARTPHPFLPIKTGQSLLGDLWNLGITERQYRSAKYNLQKWGFATFKATNKGTIATLCNSDIYNINAEQTDEQIDSQPTSNRRATDEQPTTNNNVKKEKNEKNISLGGFIFDKGSTQEGSVSQEFEAARNLYPGTKRGYSPEFENFKKKNADYKEILPLLAPAIEREIAHKDALKAANQFCPSWANFQTWINQKRWTQEFATEKPPQEVVDPKALEWHKKNELARKEEREENLKKWNQKQCS